MKPLLQGGTKVCSNGPGHMTKVAAMNIYGKKPTKIFFSETEWPMTLKLGIQHWGLGFYQVCSHDDPWLTLTCFIQGPVWSLRLLYGKKSPVTVDF